MIILPAIDIKKGECVRLYKGNFDTVEKVAENPMDTARAFEKSGATWLHMVDLDGALEGKQVNRDIFIDIAQNTSLKVEVGGGIRTMNIIDDYIGNGISRVILGSAALRDKDFVEKAVQKYGDKIAVGIDAKNGFVSADGWLDVSTVNYIDFAKLMESIGEKYIIFTNIDHDGTLSGADFNGLFELQNAVSMNIIASGGIRDINDIEKLRTMNLYGTICGKSLYSGTLDLSASIKCANKE
jgi:phosphoribosylformimino-5-aminoimidazole carboxamide ribotide isomerase